MGKPGLIIVDHSESKAIPDIWMFLIGVITLKWIRYILRPETEIWYSLILEGDLK